MKRHGDLFKYIVAMDNLHKAHRDARRGKSHYDAVQMVNANEDELLASIQDSLINKTFSTANYRIKQIREPKERTIYILPYYPDRIVQHAVMNVIQPIWDKVFIYDTYSAIPGRGIHAAIDRLDKFLDQIPSVVYCLQFDIKSYYPTMNHKVLKKLIRRKIKCTDTLWLLDDVINSVSGEVNIPIGNYLSQYFGNIYLCWMDHWLKEIKQVKYYIRYNDDGVILHTSKGVLHHLLEAIRWYLNNNLQMSLNPKTQIYPVDKRGIDFLGYRTFRTYRLLRKRSAKKFKRKMRWIKEQWRSLDPQHIVSSIMSYVGWLQHADCFNLLREYVLDDVKLLKVFEQACAELDIENPLRKKYKEALAL